MCSRAAPGASRATGGSTGRRRLGRTARDRVRARVLGRAQPRARAGRGSLRDLPHADHDRPVRRPARRQGRPLPAGGGRAPARHRRRHAGVGAGPARAQGAVLVRRGRGGADPLRDRSRDRRDRGERRRSPRRAAIRARTAARARAPAGSTWRASGSSARRRASASRRRRCCARSRARRRSPTR